MCFALKGGADWWDGHAMSTQIGDVRVKPYCSFNHKDRKDRKQKIENRK